jgi:cysteine desulfurase
MRSGTLFTPQIVGFAKAVELAMAELELENQRQRELKEKLWAKISQLDGISLNGHPDQRLAGNLNFSVEGVNGTALLLGLQSIVAVSSGSACSSASTRPSHVLVALGHSEALAYSSLRIGLGRFTTPEEIDLAGDRIVDTIKSLRKGVNKKRL